MEHNNDTHIGDVREMVDVGGERVEVVVNVPGEEGGQGMGGVPHSPSGVWEEGKELGEVGGVDEGGDGVDGKPPLPKQDSYSTPSPTIPTLLTLAPLDPLPPTTHAPDSPTTHLLTTLRSQITLLTDQSTALNSKLIASVSRVSNLEDTLEVLGESKRGLEVEKEELERQKREWEESMRTGSLVERGQVRDEMQRLVEGLVEEERRRGSAEEGRKRIEREVDDLSVSLFEQANTMVASERMFRLRAETQLQEAEANLTIAESAVQQMQQHLQSLPTLLPAPTLTPSASLRRYLATPLPHAEFLAFLTHLRMSKPQFQANAAYLAAPVVSMLLSQPFIARVEKEDHDPTLRLDTAPDLSWLSRRAVNSAIMAGELIIEPVGANVLLSSTAYASASGEIGCSMCGKPVFPTLGRDIPGSPASGGPGGGQLPPPVHPKRGSSAGTGRFSLKPFFNSPSATTSSPSASPLSSPAPGLSHPMPPVYIFRIAPTTVATSSAAEKEKETRLYPLCHTGWCLARLRATCELWRFVRTGIVEVVWKGEDGWVPPTPRIGRGDVVSNSPKGAGYRSSMPALPVRRVSEAGTGVKDIEAELGEKEKEKEKEGKEEGERPELPPRKRSGMGMGWGLGFKFGAGRNSTGTTPEPEVEGGKIELLNEGGKNKEVVEGQEVKEATLEGEKVEVTEAVKDEEVEQDEKNPATLAKDSADSTSTQLAGPTDPPTEQAETPAQPDIPLPSPAESDTDGDNHFSTPKEGSIALRSPEVVVEEDMEEGEKTVDDGKGGKDEDVLVEKSAEAEKAEEKADEKEETSEIPADDSEPPTPITPIIGSDHTDRPGTPTRPVRRSAPPHPSGTGAVPPPIPTRAARRPVTRPTSIIVDHPDHGPVESSASTPVTPRIDEPSTPDPGSEVVDLSHASGRISLDEPTRSAPPLPDRTPKNPAARHSEGSARGEGEGKNKKYVEGSGWEAKTWREVVRLKEEMWRARVGVVEGEDA